MIDPSTEGEVQLFRQLFDLMPQLGWTAQADGFIDFYNKQWYSYTGTTYEEMLGWGWEKVHDPNYLPKVIEGWKRSIDTETAFEMEFPLKRIDGCFRMFFTRVQPIRDEQGKLLRWVGINTDIQDERDSAAILERQVQERTEQLQQALTDSLIANKAKSQFVSTISHEVRTPLSGVIGLAELLSLDKKLEGEPKTIALEIFGASKRLLQLLNDILDFSKYESGQMKLEYRAFSIPQLVNDVVQSFELNASKKLLKLVVSLDSDLPTAFCGDELRLRQILNNLVSNAIKFTDAGQITIAIRIEEKTAEQITARFSVMDTGMGLRQEERHRLFKPFTQADESISRRFGGTGLGLAISKNYVEMMGGTMDVDSEVGKGSTFWFTVTFPRGESPSCPA